MTLSLLGLVSAGLIGCSRKEGRGLDFSSTRIQGVRFDPSYYYNLKQPLETFVDSSVAAWRGYGINTVFFKAYDPEFGAVYKTKYQHNRQTDYADKDLMGLFIKACHRHGLRFMVWLPVFEHKEAWEKNPAWRIKGADGSDLMPFPDHHFLCVRQEGFVKWWTGFLKDILDRYPDIDGVDLAEPAIVWKGTQTCQCPVCEREIGKDAFTPDAVRKRSEGLTDLLLQSNEIVSAAGKTSCITFIATAGADSRVLPFSLQKELSGLDLDRLLDSPHRPAWLSAELMWQQWADTYDNPATFRPDWTRKAVEQSLAEVRDRTHFLAHVEITPLGTVEVSPDELRESIVAARQGGAQSIEFYDTHLVDSMAAWQAVQSAWNTHSERQALVLHDPNGEGVAKQVAALFGHFDLRIKVLPADSFQASQAQLNDLVAYVGSEEGRKLPSALLDYASRPDVRILWANFNLGQLERTPIAGGSAVLSRLGLKLAETRRSLDFNTVLYKGQELFKSDSVLNIVQVTDSLKVNIHAWAVSEKGERHPYIVQSGNFWYVADCPTDYIAEGGREIALSDLLHDITGEDHPVQHTGLVRIEDVCPLSDPKAVREVADILSSEGVPFSIALVPFYIDPEENIAVSLSDKPEFVEAIRYAMKKGAAIVHHGTTHQYRGRSTFDYEFWDALHNTPLFEDNREYVRSRIQEGLDEMHKHGIYPVVFEAPHYAASQLDYSIIDEFYSAEYGRRQVIDETGFDQLIPFFIGRHPSGNSMIPENLGYVPNDLQKSAPLLRFAKNNLAVRDGFASFFFHLWIDKTVLRELVVGIRDQGYVFSDIRNIPLKAVSKGHAQVTGNQELSLQLENRYLRTFFVDAGGKKRREWYSDTPISREFKQHVQCPPGWTFVAEAVPTKASWYSKLPMPKVGALTTLKDKVFSVPALKLSYGRPARPCILWDGDSSSANSNGDSFTQGAQGAWANAFGDLGIEVDTIDALNFVGVPEEINLVIVPSSAGRKLGAQQAVILAQAIAAGKSIILEGPSQLAEQMGIRATDSGKTVTEIRDEYFPQVSVTWKEPSRYYHFDADVEYVSQYSTLDGEPLVAGGEYGKGKYLFFATEFSGNSSPSSQPSPSSASSGPDRFPFFLDLIEREFGLRPAIRSPKLEVYYDPSTREDASLEDLVILWRKNGVRIVHVAGWHDYADYTFEYGELVNLLHRYGMLAYAWFELPHISEKFWLTHPQWREKSASGADAEIGWRKLMNMTNDTCRAGAFNAIKRLVMLAPWDGINLAGGMFEGEDPGSPAGITPMHPSFRARYGLDKGYDPQTLFNPSSSRANHSVQTPGRPGLQVGWTEFLDYRDSLEHVVLGECLNFLRKQNPLRKVGAEIIVTRRMDKASVREVAWYAGVAAEDTLVRLQAMMPGGARVNAASIKAFILRLSADSSSAPADWQPMIELDLDIHRPASGHTEQLCGAELLGIVAMADREGIRISLRTEANIYDTDFRGLAYAAAASIREEIDAKAWKVSATRSTTLDFDEKTVSQVRIGERIWPGFDRGRAILPMGEQILQGCSRFAAWSTFLLSPVKISGFSGVITEARNTLKGLQMHYHSPQEAFLRLSQVPKEIRVDGLPYFTSEPEPGSEPSEVMRTGILSLPAGTHRVDISTRPLASSMMRQSSVFLSAGIVVVSSLTVLAFVLLHIGGAVGRMFSRRATDKNPDRR